MNKTTTDKKAHELSKHHLSNFQSTNGGVPDDCPTDFGLPDDPSADWGPLALCSEGCEDGAVSISRVFSLNTDRSAVTQVTVTNESAHQASDDELSQLLFSEIAEESMSHDQRVDDLIDTKDRSSLSKKVLGEAAVSEESTTGAVLPSWDAPSTIHLEKEKVKNRSAYKKTGDDEYYEGKLLPELKELCRQRGLMIGGPKHALIKRLKEQNKVGRKRTTRTIKGTSYEERIAQLVERAVQGGVIQRRGERRVESGQHPVASGNDNNNNESSNNDVRDEPKTGEDAETKPRGSLAADFTAPAAAGNSSAAATDLASATKAGARGKRVFRVGGQQRRRKSKAEGTTPAGKDSTKSAAPFTFGGRSLAEMAVDISYYAKRQKNAKKEWGSFKSDSPRDSNKKKMDSSSSSWSSSRSLPLSLTSSTLQSPLVSSFSSSSSPAVPVTSTARPKIGAATNPIPQRSLNSGLIISIDDDDASGGAENRRPSCPDTSDGVVASTGPKESLSFLRPEQDVIVDREVEMPQQEEFSSSRRKIGDGGENVGDPFIKIQKQFCQCLQEQLAQQQHQESSKRRRLPPPPIILRDVKDKPVPGARSAGRHRARLADMGTVGASPVAMPIMGAGPFYPRGFGMGFPSSGYPFYPSPTMATPMATPMASPLVLSPLLPSMSSPSTKRTPFMPSIPFVNPMLMSTQNGGWFDDPAKRD